MKRVNGVRLRRRRRLISCHGRVNHTDRTLGSYPYPAGNSSAALGGSSHEFRRVLPRSRNGQLPKYAGGAWPAKEPNDRRYEGNAQGKYNRVATGVRQTHRHPFGVLAHRIVNWSTEQAANCERGHSDTGDYQNDQEYR